MGLVPGLQSVPTATRTPRARMRAASGGACRSVRQAPGRSTATTPARAMASRPASLTASR